MTGLIGQYPFGGVVWDYIQYVIGFRNLGHDVFYLEDSGAWPYDPINKTISKDCTYNVHFLSKMMSEFSLQDRWIYRNAADGSFHGLGETMARELMREGDLLVNVSTASWLKHYDLGIKHQMFIDGDPMFCQAGICRDPKSDYTKRLLAHDSHFTFGLKVGEPDCLAPDTGIEWKKTVQPIALEYWKREGDHFVKASPEPKQNSFPSLSESWTTVMNWMSYKPMIWEGEAYLQKSEEFQKFEELPAKSNHSFSVAMGQGVGAERPTEHLKSKGWHILEPDESIPNHWSYRDFIGASYGEWSIAKHGFVKGRTGWFSCRSACYLAAGKPVLVQDTGWTDVLPSGEGVFAFVTMNDCLTCLDRMKENYKHHCDSALAFAKKHFDSTKVCHELLEQAKLI